MITALKAGLNRNNDSTYILKTPDMGVFFFMKGMIVVVLNLLTGVYNEAFLEGKFLV